MLIPVILNLRRVWRERSIPPGTKVYSHLHPYPTCHIHLYPQSSLSSNHERRLNTTNKVAFPLELRVSSSSSPATAMSSSTMSKTTSNKKLRSTTRASTTHSRKQHGKGVKEYGGVLPYAVAVHAHRVFDRMLAAQESRNRRKKGSLVSGD